MTHEMKLHKSPFTLIKSGIKTIELRLYDEKRRSISVGDTILFKNCSAPEEEILCLVTGIYIFESFRELYSALPLLNCGYTEEDIMTASPEDMNKYYPPEEQAKSGVIGIEIKLIG